MDCDVVLIPPKEVGSQAVKASRTLSKLGGSFVLEDGAFYPHLSLYILRLKFDSMERASALLRNVADNTRTLQLSATGHTSSHKYLVVNYKKTPELAMLQSKLVEGLNPLRDGMPESERENMRHATDPAALKNFEQYGYKYIGEFFAPHVTLIRFTEDHPLEELVLPNLSLFDGRFASIGLFKLGPHSTCTSKLAEFPLAG